VTYTEGIVYYTEILESH